MAMVTEMDMRGLEPVDPPSPLAMPALSAPAKSPYFISNFPIAGPNNSYAATNFAVSNIPFHAIQPAQPLNLPGAAISATVSQVPKLLTPVPAPTIASPLVSVAAGYQFSYNEVRLPLGASFTINSYKIYKNTVNSSASASVIQTNPHNINGLSTPVVITDNVPNGVTQFYWVSAVSTSGQESNLTPAQTGTVANTALANANSQLASSAKNNPINVSWLPTNSVTLSNDGAHTAINIASNTNQFGFGATSLNSGTVDPGNTGTYYVFAIDPTFAGGAAPYHASTSALSALVESEGSLILGAIATSLTAGAATGGGFSGGTSATTGGLGGAAIGGRGIGLNVVQI